MKTVNITRVSRQARTTVAAIKKKGADQVTGRARVICCSPNLPCAEQAERPI